MKVRQLIGFSFIVIALVIVYFTNSIGEYRQPKQVTYQYSRGASVLEDSEKQRLASFVSPYISDPRFRFIIKAHTQSGYGQYRIIVVTDGEAGDSNLLELTVNDIIANTPIKLITIGFRIGAGHTLNREGVTYLTANNAEEIGTALMTIKAETDTFDTVDFQ